MVTGSFLGIKASFSRVYAMNRRRIIIYISISAVATQLMTVVNPPASAPIWMIARIILCATTDFTNTVHTSIQKITFQIQMPHYRNIHNEDMLIDILIRCYVEIFIWFTILIFSIIND